MTILVKNQYVQRRFRLLGARWGRVMTDFIFFPARGRVSGDNFFRMTEYFLKSRFSGFLAFSGLEIFHATILVKNQYVQLRFRLLGTRWGRVMTDSFFFPARGPSPLGRILPMGKILLKGHGWAKTKNKIPWFRQGQN